jgi:tetratricopeptide (TPR) repeat protein
MKPSITNQTNQNMEKAPSQMEVNSLLANYQNGKYDLAENLAKELTLRYPNHQFSWKLLCALFKQTGRLKESLIASQRVVAILPNDAEAHCNMGVILKGLFRLEEAEVSYKKAIT